MSTNRPDVFKRILTALPLAHQLVASSGIDYAAEGSAQDGPSIVILEFAALPASLNDLFGEDDEPQTTERHKAVEQYVEAAYTVGIAVGLLLNPTLVFTKGGGR